MTLMDPPKDSSFPRIFPLARLVTKTSPAIQPVTANWPVVPKMDIYSLWNSPPAALSISPVLGVMILSLL